MALAVMHRLQLWGWLGGYAVWVLPNVVKGTRLNSRLLALEDFQGGAMLL